MIREKKKKQGEQARKKKRKQEQHQRSNVLYVERRDTDLGIVKKDAIEIKDVSTAMGQVIW